MGMLGFLLLKLTLFRAQLECLQCLFKVFFFHFKSTGRSEQTVMALCVKVLMTQFSCKGMLTVPLHVLIFVSWLPAHWCLEESVRFWHL